MGRLYLRTPRPMRRPKPPPAPPPAPGVELPARAYFLFGGPVAAITESVTRRPFFQRANIWWPQDRAWCVATEIVFMSTNVGGTEACIEALMASPELETAPVGIGDGVTYESDRINPEPPGSPYRIS
ncbi:MAG: hypothetical protein ACE5GC_07635 [Acidimicrobiia bacterium]